jgi:heme/copper-type cytochrome/quinol oxidase subunit 2
MSSSPEQAFQAWLLKMEIIGGTACLLIFVGVLAVAVILVVNYRKKRD